jgi:predicted SAM-dependent methyltransferase
VDLVYDLSKTLPFKNNQLSGIFSEHCLEHLPFDLVVGQVMGEFHRILAPGGRLRIVVPDGGAYIQKYHDSLQGKQVEFPVPDPKMKTPMMYVNQCFRHHGHLYAYDAHTLIYFLNMAGFSHAVRESFNSGGDPNLLIDAPERASESLYVEAIKPQ